MRPTRFFCRQASSDALRVYENSNNQQLVFSSPCDIYLSGEQVDQLIITLQSWRSEKKVAEEKLWAVD